MKYRVTIDIEEPQARFLVALLDYQETHQAFLKGYELSQIPSMQGMDGSNIDALPFLGLVREWPVNEEYCVPWIPGIDINKYRFQLSVIGERIARMIQKEQKP